MSSRRRIIVILVFVGCLLLIEIVPALRRGLWPIEQLNGRVVSITHDRVAQLKKAGASFFGIDQSEVQSLRSQVAALEFDRARLKKLESDNLALRETLSLRENQAWQLLATRVVGSDPLNPGDAVVLGAGTHDGVVTGAAVIDPHGLLVGIVDAVGDATSTVRVLRARGVKLAARVVGRDQMVGVLESTDGLSLTLEQLPKDGDLKTGDVVMTGAETPEVQPGIPIGTVLSIKGSPEDLWRQAVVGPFGSLTTTDIVSVVLPRVHAP